MTALTVEHRAAVRLAAFAGLSALAAYRYAGIETRPPTARVLAVAASAVVAAAALMRLRAGDPDDRRARTGAAAGWCP